MLVTIDNYLRFQASDLPLNVVETLQSALDVVNPEDDSERVSLWSADYEGNMVVARGFAHKLVKGLRRFDIDVEWDDQRVCEYRTDHLELLPFVEPRWYQEKAVERMVCVDQGIYEAPPAAGKTISTIKYMVESGLKTVVLVNKINIATQWVASIKEATGYDAGLIGGGTWDEKDITVVVLQTLYARREELDAMSWWDRWGSVVLDECHAVSAPSVRDIIQRFKAKDRLGLSATPDRHDWLTLISRSIIGEIFCRTTDEELEDEGVLVKPIIVAVKTDFAFNWEPKMKNGKPNKKYNPRKQFAQLIKELKFDVQRNRLFAQLISQQRWHTVLVHTDHKGHAHELASQALAAGWPAGKVWLLTGDQSGEERDAIIARAAEGDILILSTIGQEAMNIPRLNRFFMVFPTKNAPMVKQMVGRVKRAHDTKIEPPVVFDFYDWLVGPTREHFTSRRGEYERLDLELKIMDGASALAMHL